MRGSVLIVYPTAVPLGELRVLDKPPSFNQISKELGGLIEVLPHWDHFMDANQRLVPALVLVNQEAIDLQMPINLWSTATWHFYARAKGFKLQQHLYGKVMLFTGDEDFLHNVLD